MGQLTALEPDPRVERVTIRGRTLDVRPLTVARTPAFLREGGPALLAIFAGESLQPLFKPATPAGEKLALVSQLLAEHQQALVNAIAVALDESPADLAQLNPAELVELVAAVLGVNLDFFVRAVAPQLGRLALHLVRIQSRLSSATSSAPPRA
ncbi:MAG TPA: hypothetical protein VHE37_09010 [Nevskiaceae bacterium]|nr:hypothetical protein [Nevskiaceae bacterium]